MAPQVGFEPTTDRLTADSSTTELLRNNTYPNQAKNLPLDSTLYIIFIVSCIVNKKSHFFQKEIIILVKELKYNIIF